MPLTTTPLPFPTFLSLSLSLSRSVWRIYHCRFYIQLRENTVSSKRWITLFRHHAKNNEYTVFKMQRFLTIKQMMHAASTEFDTASACLKHVRIRSFKISVSRYDFPTWPVHWPILTRTSLPPNISLIVFGKAASQNYRRCKGRGCNTEWRMGTSQVPYVTTRTPDRNTREWDSFGNSCIMFVLFNT